MAPRIPLPGWLTGRQTTPALPSPGNTPPTQPAEQTLGHTPPAQPPSQVRPTPGRPPFGGSGRANFYGLPQWDELNAELSGVRGLRVFDDMYWSDAHIRRLVLAAWSPITAGTWTLEPYGGEDATDQDRKIAETIWWMLNDFMSPNFYEHLYEVGPALLRFGFVPFEQQWDTCTYEGKTLLAPRKLGFMLPQTIWRWWQDDYGDLTHIGQILPNKPDVVVAATELCYYRLASEGDNWMGRSLLRHAFKHWLLKDRLERIQAVGCERSAKGVPVVYHSPDVAAQVQTQLELALANLHVSEVGYLMVPGWKMGAAPLDADPAAQFLIDVVQYNSASDDAITKAIDYHQTAISSSFLTDFLELGHHQVGARATADVQEDPFITAINGALLPPVLPTLNEFIDRIRCLNWGSADGSPQLKLTLHDESSMSEIAGYVQMLVSSEAMQVDSALEDFLRERAGLPTADPDVRAQRQAAQKAAMENAAQPLDSNGEPKGAEPANPDATTTPAKKPAAKPPAKPKASDNKPSMSKKLDSASPIAAGLVVHAKDTGNVLMVQRQTDHGDDEDARGKWEFPGGKLETGETPWQGGLREWQEETGAQLPDTANPAGTVTSPDGAYRYHIVHIPQQDELRLGTHDPKEVADVRWKNPASIADDEHVRGKVRKRMPAIRGLLGSKNLHAPILLDKADRTIAIDFDGVIADHRTGEPVRDPVSHMTAMDVLPRLAKEYRIVIFTANPDQEMVKRWLEDHGLGEFAGAVTSEKPEATAYVDDNGVQFTTWRQVAEQVVAQVRRGRNPRQPKALDAPSPPPNLRVSDSNESEQPEKECGTCRMFNHGECWGYGLMPVDGEWVCDSWELSPAWREQDAEQDQADGVNPKSPAAAGKQLEDAFAPMSGGTSGDSGLQMVPETGADECTCKTRDGKRVRSKTCPVHGTDKPTTLDATVEPTVKWWERLLSQDRLREALDGARDHIQAAVTPQALLAARQLAHQAANGTPISNTTPPSDLVDALTQHYTAMYELGHDTVQVELAKQRAALGKQLDGPGDLAAAGAAAGSRLARARQRGQHSAQNIVNKISEILGRQQISGLQPAAAQTAAAEQAAAGALRMEALTNTAAMINDGRYDSAMSANDVVGAYYTSVLDERTCGACEKADDGQLLSPDAAVAQGPPNPDCDGSDRCRCALVWVLADDPAALAAAF